MEACCSERLSRRSEGWPNSGIYLGWIYIHKNCINSCGRTVALLTILSNHVRRLREWWLSLLRMTGCLTLMRKKCKAKTIPDARNSITWQHGLIFSAFCSTLVIDLCSIYNCRGAPDECLPWLLQNVRCWEWNFSLLRLSSWCAVNGK